MPLPSKVRFERFEFDAVTGELWLGGARVPLQPQPSRLLALLLAKRGEVVTRDEIRTLLWGGDVNVDFDRSLNFCVARLRAALGDTAADPRFVETLPTRGYRFRADAEIFRLEPEATDINTSSVASAFRRKDTAASHRLVVVVALAIVAVIALRVFSPWDASAPKVVVVPFQNETGSSDLDRVAKGVSDATVVKLATTNGLRVIGNASGLRLSFRPPDMKAMGESLGAQYLVLGQMKRDNQRMRIVAHLIRVSDQTHVWAKTYDTDNLDLPQQTTIADEIAAAVATRIGRRG